MDVLAVTCLIDIVAAIVAWQFEIPIPGCEGKPGPELYAMATTLYWWAGLPPAMVLTGKM